MRLTGRQAAGWRATFRRVGGRVASAAAALALAGCASLPPPAMPAPPAAALAAPIRPPVTILVSIDGFRPDYLQRGATPNLSRLAAAGVTGPMRPSFPSKTFPNHWTLVTGLVPDRTGIVGNAMDDAALPDRHFTMATDDPVWWNAAEPIWVTAERAGIRTGTVLWPGANVAWGGRIVPGHPHADQGGTRPADWLQYNEHLTGTQRVDTVIEWLRRPPETRPRFVTLYFDIVDTAGHENGPDAAATTAAVAHVDRDIGHLVAALQALGQPANLVIVSDHGMAATAGDRVIALDSIAAPADYKVEESGVYASLFAVPGHEAALEAALLRPRPHLQCWRKRDIPARFHYGRNPRVPPYLCLAEPGWLIEKTTPTGPVDAGGHGYDNDAPAMRALFIAAGPAFRPATRLPVFDNTAIAPLLRDLIGLPARNGLDGSDAPFRRAFAR